MATPTHVSGTINQNTEWTTAGSPYVVDFQGVTVAQGVTLTVDPGVVVKFGSTQITVAGTLNATGAVFTSIRDDEHGGDTDGDGGAIHAQAGDWKNITFDSAATGSLNSCTFLFGGQYTGASGMVIVSSTATISISGSTFSKSESDGLYISSGSGGASITGSFFSLNSANGLRSDQSLTTLSGNSFTGNSLAGVSIPATMGANVTNNTYSGNRYDGMYLTGHVTGSTTWPLSNSPYVVAGVYEGNYPTDRYTDIKSGATLTIETGSIVKFLAERVGQTQANPYGGIDVQSQGTLNADGVIFTSLFDDSYGGDINNDSGANGPRPGDWRNIAFEQGSSGNISNSTILYGGSLLISYYDRGEVYISDASPTITNTAIAYSGDSGIFVWSGSPSIHYDDIFANGSISYGLSKQSGTLDATHNYWGSKHGPKPYGSGNGVHNATVSPWSGVPFTQAGAAYQATLGMADYCAMCGDPINTATGAFVYQHTDIKVPTKGVPLDFERTYNSNDASDGDLGFGWSYNWQVSANPLANGNVDILRGDGRQDIFTLNQDGSYSPPASVHDTLVKNQDGTYKLTSRDQITYNFNTANQLVSVVSESGQTTTLTYDTNKRLTTITEPAGRTIGFAYNAANRISQITDPAGNHVSIAYSDAGDLTSVTDQNGGETSFAYDSFHHITSVTDPNNHASANNTYDAGGKVVSQTDADGKLITFAYDTANNETTMTRQMDPGDPSKDEVTEFYYDSQLRLIKETDPYGKDTLYSYDADGNRDTVTDRAGAVTRQVFDAAGNVTDSYKAYGASEQEHTNYTYNGKNHPTAKTDPRGYTTNYGYDQTGTYLTQVAYPAVTSYDNTVSNFTESFTYNTDGTRATHTDANGDVTAYAYDNHGNLASETRNTNRGAADQVTIVYVFDLMGRKTQEADGNGHTTTIEYDNLGNLRYETRQVTDPGTNQLVDVVIENQYDSAGNRVKVIDAEGKATNYSFTPTNRLSEITDAKLNTVQYTYDAAGNRTGAKDRNGNWSYFSFDKNNRMAGATDPENNVTTYGYDDVGNQTSVTDPLGRTATKTYDRIGRASSSSEPDEGSATRTTTYAYNAGDNLTSTTDPLSHTTTYAYDELGCQKQVTDPAGNSTFAAYDGAGNRVKTKDAAGHETNYTYSPNDFLASVTDPMGGATGYAYDKVGNRTSQTDAEGHVTYYSYDELNREKEEKVDAGSGSYLLERTFTYDKTGHLLTDTTGEGTITNTYDDVYDLTGVTDRENNTYSFSYDANQNQLAATDNGSNKTVSFSYSSRGELSGAADANGGGESYSYDAAGNLSQRQDSVGGQNFSTNFAYTPRNQLKQVSIGSDTTGYSFDAAGNLASKSYQNSIGTSYSYDSDNRLTALTATKNGQTLQSYSQDYDQNGNVTSLTEAAGTSSYTYDAQNRLTNESVAGYGSVSYAYDKTGNRLSKTEPAATGGPGLSLSMARVYWASWEDYYNRLLSIDYHINNSGPGTAFSAKATSATATNGVYATTQMPVSLGDISQGGYAPATIKYYIPTGVTGFNTTVYSTCNDTNGASWYYPAKRTTYAYNQANELTSDYDSSGLTTSSSYNSGGALTQKTDGTNTTSYDYNGLDKLTGVTTPSTTVSYSYDALGRRISRTEGANTSNYHHDAKTDLIDYETNADTELIASYNRGADGLISQTDYTGQSPVTSYDLYSPHGDTSAIADQYGNITGTYRYDAFGNAITANNLTDAYTGKWQRETDLSTGTIRMGVREYDPSLGRFISPDPLKGDPTDPQQRNRYEYVGSDPLTHYDLSGYSMDFWTKGWQGVAGGANNQTWGGAALIAGGASVTAGAEAVGEGVVIGGAGTIVGGAVAGGFIAYGGYETYLEGGSPAERYNRVYENNRCLLPPPDDGIHWGPAAEQNGMTISNAKMPPSRELAKRLGIPYERLRNAVHRIKDQGVRPGKDVVIDDQTGDVYYRDTGEWIGNVYQEY